MFEFDGILLKPCLLQPCFHVAGSRAPAAVDEAHSYKRYKCSIETTRGQI